MRTTAVPRKSILLHKLHSRARPNRGTVTSVIAKHGVWKWSEDFKSAFHELRNKLVQESVLQPFPQWKEEFYIEEEASLRAVAAVLSQEDVKSRNVKSCVLFLFNLVVRAKKLLSRTIGSLGPGRGYTQVASIFESCTKSNSPHRPLSSQMVAESTGSNAYICTMVNGVGKSSIRDRISPSITELTSRLSQPQLSDANG